MSAAASGTKRHAPHDDGEAEMADDAGARFTPSQKRAIAAIMSGKNVLLTGAGGTGKSHVTQEVVRRLSAANKVVLVSATTGIAAVSIGGKTLHSTVRLRPSDEDMSAAEVAERVSADHFFRKSMREAHTLIIDEISMVTQRTFQQVDAILRACRGNGSPFGGMQIILVGDFFQLPPVDKGNDGPTPLVFDLDLFYHAITESHVLQEVMRQSDPAFIALLMRAQRGALSAEDCATLRARVGAKLPDDGIKPTKLFALNRNVDAVNAEELNKLRAPPSFYKLRQGHSMMATPSAGKKRKAPYGDGARGGGGGGGAGGGGGGAGAVGVSTPHGGGGKREEVLIGMRDKMVGALGGAARVELKVGAQVMLTYNLSMAEGLCNGSRGVVVGFSRRYSEAQAARRAAEAALAQLPRGSPEYAAALAKLPPAPELPSSEADFLDPMFEENVLYPDEAMPIIDFVGPDGRKLRKEVPYVRYSRDERGLGSVWAWVMPLKLAWACSVHKCVDGDTLVAVDGRGLVPIRDLAPADAEEGTWSTPTEELRVVGAHGTRTVCGVYTGVVEDAVRVTTSRGFELVGSVRHPLLTLRAGGKLQWTKLPELQAGDVVVMRSSSAAGASKYVSTASFSFGGSGHTAIPAAVTPAVAHLLGLLVGDGSLGKNYSIELELSKGDRDVIDAAAAHLRNLFAYDTPVSALNEGRLFRFNASSKHIRAFFDWCGLHAAKAADKETPHCVLASPLDVQAAFLRGLFDADGGCSKSRVHFTTTSGKLATEVQIMLANLGVIASRAVLAQGHAFQVTITGNAAAAFSATVGFGAARKAAALAAYANPEAATARRCMDCALPGGKDIAAEIVSAMQATGALSSLREDAAIALKRAAAGTSQLRVGDVRLISAATPQLAQLGSAGRLLAYIADNSLFVDAVRSVTQAGPRHLFDLEVEAAYDAPFDDAHDFVAGAFLNHNSQGMSLDRVELCLDGTIFAAGQAYVALSRVRSLQGLTLTAFEPSVVNADDRVVEFYSTPYAVLRAQRLAALRARMFGGTVAAAKPATAAAAAPHVAKQAEDEAGVVVQARDDASDGEDDPTLLAALLANE